MLCCIEVIVGKTGAGGRGSQLVEDGFKWGRQANDSGIFKEARELFHDGGLGIRFPIFADHQGLRRI